ncbi:toxin of the YoeB-YefM toxin-antitoxin system [Candidatus Methylobacter favarea]|uniref:Putative mRNA interferase YoeB n=1 Tax=Candidatus Methylobacter favarea TaxID=2707345 RepID=A0A8S0WRD3_9GAMM|nr:Txe/YoeB family addiction module toxin [Candidatus Methylobacter favarea]CAA9891981.1 toxin of the YoeB-YefM toxin-antitoxin system [Candidatus Methylobacter favarea]
MSRKLAWTEAAWTDYLYWQGQDKKTLKRINKLIADVKRTPFEGMGKPEALRENLSGFWSRRIDESNRLVYAVDNEHLTIIACRYHYET